VLGSGPGGTAEPIGDVLDRRLAWHLVVPAVHGRLDGLELPVGQPAGRLQSARVLVGLREMEQSARIVEQCLDLNPNWPKDDREVQANVPRTTKPEADAEVYRAVEAAKGNWASTFAPTGLGVAFQQAPRRRFAPGRLDPATERRAIRPQSVRTHTSRTPQATAVP